MSDGSHLPDDVDRWPDDPFELLGIARSSEPSEVRRAYVRLIRRYKPEHFPEHFRRIREAYELLKARHESPPEQPPILFGGGARSFSLDKLHESSRADRDEMPAADGADPLGELDEAWGFARDGKLPEAYRRLVVLEQRQPGQEEACLRLYWLLEIAPELDPQRDACAWLVEGLHRRGLRGRLMELYSRELDRRPQEGLSSRCERLLANPAPAARAVDFVVKRWRAATGWETIAADLERLRPRIEHDDFPAWVRLLLAAADHLAWCGEEEARELLGRCLEEAERCPEVHTELDEEFTRLDLLQELVAGCGSEQFKAVAPAGLGELLRDSWNAPFATIRPRLLELVLAWIQEPQHGLDCLDRLREACPAVLTQLGNLIDAVDQQQNTLGGGRRLELEDEAFELLADRNWLNYSKLRGDLLRFCLREAITVAQFVETVMESGRMDSIRESELPAHAMEDVALRSLCKAYRAFWG